MVSQKLIILFYSLPPQRPSHPTPQPVNPKPIHSIVHPPFQLDSPRVIPLPSNLPLFLSLLRNFEQLLISGSWADNPVGGLLELEWGGEDDGCAESGDEGGGGFEWGVDEGETVRYYERVELVLMKEEGKR